MRLLPHDVLLVVDVQRDFLPGGTLAVPEGHDVIAPINRLDACRGIDTGGSLAQAWRDMAETGVQHSAADVLDT